MNGWNMRGCFLQDLRASLSACLIKRCRLDSVSDAMTYPSTRPMVICIVMLMAPTCRQDRSDDILGFATRRKIILRSRLPRFARDVLAGEGKEITAPKLFSKGRVPEVLRRRRGLPVAARSSPCALRV